ncbi:oligosaccharide flippase family protein [Candidatus Pacearchaeota archaeon]|nr:oligosaccharide flippase family protein [Candidatus Pacearchaeota archaeon]
MDLKKISSGIFGGSIILLITINLFNALNYFFHFIMVRLLSAADYGVLAALMSITYIFNIFSESIQTIMARYTSRENSNGKIKNILRRSFKKSFKIASALIVFYLLISLFLKSFLNIDYSLLSLTGLAIFAVFLTPVGRGALQGKKRFKSFGFNMIFESVAKLALGIFFVYLGWRVYGAILAVIIASFIALLLSFFSLKDIFSSRETKTDSNKIYVYSIPVFVIMFSIISFYSLDVILAKAFFTGEVAGQYAIASVLSKIILFGTLPVSKAMFPLSSEQSKNGKAPKTLLNKSLLILGLGVTAALLIIGLFPGLMIRIFSGEYYSAASGILLNLSIAMSLMSFTNLILLYKLSVGRIRNYKLMIIFPVIELAMLSAFHSNLNQYSIVLIFVNMLFLFGSFFLLSRK